ncbi:MAG: protein kinase [Pseudomonadota bacterium]
MEIAGYKILEKIGEGGMAQVYKGYQLSLKREVAIKTLSKDLLNQKGFSSRFSRESLIIAKLSNPYIIPIIERGITDEHVPFFIMEYIEGIDLKIAMKKDQLNFNQKLDICTQICKALSYAHKNGVIHRDIKPANILLDQQGNAKVMDFGIAQYYSDDIGGQKTQLGDMMGTLAYMSPEQHKSASLVTFKSDLYSMGVLMYQLFTNSEPLGRFKTPKELDHKIPDVLDQIILACLEPDPESRPDSADDIKNQLLHLLGGAHLHTEQKNRANSGLKNLELLDIIKEEGQMTISLYENKADNKLLVIHKRPIAYPGYTESKLLSTLKHQHIVNIIGTSQSEQFYILVTEYINGGTLKDRMLSPIPWKIFLAMAKAMTSGLLFAHNNRIIHGNLRPANIIFDDDDTIKLTDFGLRSPDKLNRQRKSRYKILTESPSIQADIYALGVVFYQMLTGQFPFLQGKMLKSNQFNENKFYRQLPSKLKKLLIEMLQLNYRNRPVSCLPILNVINDIVAESTQSEMDKTLLLETAKKNAYTLKKWHFLVLFLLAIIPVVYFFTPEILSIGELIHETVLDLFSEADEAPAPNYIEF